eukprot:gene15606-17494_t
MEIHLIAKFLILFFTFARSYINGKEIQKRINSGRSLVGGGTHQTKTKLKVYLHIGPHKTATSSIQHSIHHIRDDLMKKGICWPSFTNKREWLVPIPHKAVNELALDLAERSEVTPSILHATQKCFHQNLSVILSGEQFCVLNHSQITLLKDAILSVVPSGMEIEFKVIMFYREWLSRFYSFFGEIARTPRFVNNSTRLSYMSSFSRYLHHFFDYGEDITELNTLELANRYKSVFGKESLVIVDYDGMKASGKSVISLFLCDIMKIDCSHVKIEKSVKNKQSHMGYLHLAYLVYYDVNAAGLSLCNRDTWTYNFIDYYQNIDLQVPMVRNHVRFLHQHAKEVDTKFRREYGAEMLHSNQSAPLETIDNFVAVELDEAFVMSSSHWRGFFQRERERLKKEGKLCTSLSGFVI